MTHQSEESAHLTKRLVPGFIRNRRAQKISLRDSSFRSPPCASVIRSPKAISYQLNRDG